MFSRSRVPPTPGKIWDKIAVADTRFLKSLVSFTAACELVVNNGLVKESDARKDKFRNIAKMLDDLIVKVQSLDGNWDDIQYLLVKKLAPLIVPPNPVSKDGTDVKPAVQGDQGGLLLGEKFAVNEPWFREEFEKCKHELLRVLPGSENAIEELTQDFDSVKGEWGFVGDIRNIWEDKGARIPEEVYELAVPYAAMFNCIGTWRVFLEDFNSFMTETRRLLAEMDGLSPDLKHLHEEIEQTRVAVEAWSKSKSKPEATTLLMKVEELRGQAKLLRDKDALKKMSYVLIGEKRTTDDEQERREREERERREREERERREREEKERLEKEEKERREREEKERRRREEEERRRREEEERRRREEEERRRREESGHPREERLPEKADRVLDRLRQSLSALKAICDAVRLAQ